MIRRYTTAPSMSPRSSIASARFPPDSSHYCHRRQPPDDMVAQKHYIHSDITVVMHPGATIAAKVSGPVPWCCPLGAVPPAKPGWTFDAGPHGTQALATKAWRRSGPLG
jgi:hypothetical protein